MRRALSLPVVIAGLVPAIHVFLESAQQDVDARVKPGHDEAAEGARTL